MHVHAENAYRALEGLAYNPRNPMRVSQEAFQTGFTAGVTDMIGDGRIASAGLAGPAEKRRRRAWLLH